jgi:phosphate transport system substrate-binding protein
VNKKSAQRPEVQKFIKFYLDNAPQLSKEVGYVPMPQNGYDEQKAVFSKVLIKK